MPGSLLEVNSTACEMLGYSRDEFLQMTPQDIENEERGDDVPNIVSELVAEKHATFEREQVAKDGTVVPVEIGSHLFEMGGERLVLSVARDITERKRTEQRVRRLNSLLRAIRNVNQVIAEEDAPEALLERSCQMLLDAREYEHVWGATFDAEGDLLHAAGAGIGEPFQELTSRMEAGWRPECVRRALCEPEVPFVLDPARDCEDCPLSHLHEGSRSLKCGFGQKAKMKSVLGLRLAAGHEADARERDLISEVAGDIGHALLRIATQQELHRTQQQVIEQERQRALSTMASGIAHDFNNALSTILGFADLLLESPDQLSDEETVRSYLELIRKAASNAAETVRRMRKFYRPREDYVLRAVDLNVVAEEAVSMTEPLWRAQARAEGATIEVEMGFEDTGPVAGNEPELHEMLTNLIFNAVDAMPGGGTLSLRTHREDDRVLLEVSDTGTGMPEEVRERCLEPFYTTKREAGSGLGLSTVRGIVERHGGTIEVESEPGEGTTFHMLLPAHQTREQAGEVTGQAGGTTGPLEILVVEDEEDQRLLITKYLEADGHRVTTAADGEEGVRKFLDGWYNVVITDRAMLGMSGIQVARTVRKRAPDKPIIMLTGFGGMMDAAGETVDDVDVVLSKPVTMEELRNALGEVLKRHE